jgi:hypothetical protein
MNSQHYHRGDPLDIPLIDHHLLTQLLLPRLISAIRVAFPQRQKDWITDSRKRILEGVLRTCLLLGSSRHIISYVARQHRRRHDANNDFDSSGNIIYGKGGQPPRVVNHDVYVTTPAMQSLGISIRPASISDGAGGGSIIQQYGKVIALIIVTVILPICYEELKHRREKHLDERDQQFRLEEIRREFRSSMMQGVNSTSAHITSQESPSDDNDIREIEQQPHHYPQQHILNKRAMKRKSFVSALFTDSILGMGEVLYPPLKLANYLMYLWGMCSTPDLGMRMAGWDYCRVDPSSSALELGEPPSHDGESSHHQRHANFQYGHRRLMVEEALRAATMILPPRTYNAGFGGGGAASNAVVETPHSTNGRSNDLVVAPQSSRMARFGTLRKRLLSFLGIVDESNNDFAEAKNSFDTLCSLCNTIPAVPYTASCGHNYCYICLRMAVTDDLNFRCQCCGQQISSAFRAHGKLKA